MIKLLSFRQWSGGQQWRPLKFDEWLKTSPLRNKRKSKYRDMYVRCAYDAYQAPFVKYARYREDDLVFLPGERHFQVLCRRVKARSLGAPTHDPRAVAFKKVATEWRLHFITIDDLPHCSGCGYGMLPDQHIENFFHIHNPLTKEWLEVGSKCIRHFGGERIERIARSLLRIYLHPEKSLCRDTIDYLRDVRLLNLEEAEWLVNHRKEEDRAKRAEIHVRLMARLREQGLKIALDPSEEVEDDFDVF